MTDTFIQLPEDSTGKKVRVFQNTVGGEDVDAEAVVLTGPDGDVVVDADGVVIQDGGNSLTVDDGGTTLSVDDGAGSLTVDGTVAVTDGGGSITVDGPLTDMQLRATAVTVDASGVAVPVTDNGGSLTVDGAVTADTELTTADLDTGAGTDTRAVVGLVGSKSGGAQLIPGDATAGLKVDLGADNDVVVSDGGNVISVDDAGSTLSVDDGGGSLTVDVPTGVVVFDGGDSFSVDDGGGTLTVDGTVIVGDGGGSLTTDFLGQVQDNNGFTDGTTRVLMAGFILDETAGTALAENDAGAARMDSKRAMVGVIEDATTRGRRATVTAGGRLAISIDEINVGAGNPVPVSDNNSTLSVDDGGSSLSIDDGGSTITVDGTVTVQDGGGTITVDNGGTFAVQADTELTTADLDTGAGTDTRAVVGLVGSKSGGGVLIPGDATAGLKVDLGSDNDVVISDGGNSITVDDGGVTFSVDDGAGSLTVDNAGTFAVQDSQVLADNTGFTDGTTKLFMGGFIFDETAGTALTENDAAAARVDSKRAVVGVIEDGTTRGQRAAVNTLSQLLIRPPQNTPLVLGVSGSIGVLTAATWNDVLVHAVPASSVFKPMVARCAVTTAATRTLILAGKQLGTFNPNTNVFTATGSVSGNDFYDRLFYRVATAHSATATTVTATYTDQAGASSTATAVAIPASTVARSWFELPLATSDFGVQSVTNITDTANPNSVTDEVWGFRTLLEDLGPANTPHIASLAEVSIPNGETIVILFNAAATTAQQRFAQVVGQLIAA